MSDTRTDREEDIDFTEDWSDYICGSCSGSGEGRYDGSTCQTCRGSGAYTPLVEIDSRDPDDIDPWDFL